MPDLGGTEMTTTRKREMPFQALALPLDRPERSVQVSVVIPVHNEEECLPELWRRTRIVLDGIGRSWELIFVDDGSSDRSLETLMKFRAESPTVRILGLRVRRGQSAALAAGFRAALGDWIVTLDADLQNPPEEIPRLFEAMEGVDPYSFLPSWLHPR